MALTFRMFSVAATGLLLTVAVSVSPLQAGNAVVFYDTTRSPLPSNRVQYAIQDDQGVFWFACGNDFDPFTGILVEGGLVRFDGQNWQVFQTTNSGLPGNDVSHVISDGQGGVWVATLNAGIAHFDGQNWTVYNTSNSPLPEDAIYTLTLEGDSVLWVGTFSRGLLRFDGSSWQWWHEGNSPLGHDAINFIVVDSLGVKWIGMDYWGLQSFDGVSWQNHGQGLLAPGFDTRVVAMAIDPAGNRWLGGDSAAAVSAIVRYNNTAWTQIQSLTQGFTYRPAYKGIAIDAFGQPWVATRSALIHFTVDTLWEQVDLSPYVPRPIWEYGFLTVDQQNNKIVGLLTLDDSTGYPRPMGVAFFNEDSVVFTGLEPPESQPVVRHFRLDPPYPNPFNPGTQISVALSRALPVELAVYNVLGQRVAVLFEGRLPAGTHRFAFQGTDLPAGAYFVVLQTPKGRQVRRAVLLK
ncbi:MAG: T9SS C-terminal target domain-containing protein [Calditrichaeota bacterium]|nr:MAG: T9SS C-terminal target domain-containing protein [Calditrichota bacterium]